MLQIEGVGKRYGTGEHAVDALTDVSLTVADGEFAALVGPSGCGKTTLLNLIAGLDEHDAGSILVDGESPSAEERLKRFGYMPQEDLLCPWRTVLENVSLGLEVQGVGKREARQRAADLFPPFGLAGFEHRRPHELSGGMRQRASFLRTYLLGRPFLLLDEPFGALDAITRGQLQSWLAETGAGSVDRRCWSRTILMKRWRSRTASTSCRRDRERSPTCSKSTCLGRERRAQRRPRPLTS